MSVKRKLRVLICGRSLTELRRLLSRFAVQVVDRNPELVISYGGDGALLGAERDFPGVPKCPLRDRRTHPKCPEHDEAAVLELLMAGRLAESRLSKLTAETGAHQRVTGMNDIVVSKENITSAVRFRLWLDDELCENQIVGDGLVVATPFGSTGYYRSITHSLFRVGIGLAFNNTTEPLDHLVVNDGTVVTIEIIRGPALLLADNDPVRLRLAQGARVAIVKSPDEATVLGLDIFRCKDCYRLRQPQG